LEDDEKVMQAISLVIDLVHNQKLKNNLLARLLFHFAFSS